MHFHGFALLEASVSAKALSSPCKTATRALNIHRLALLGYTTSATAFSCFSGPRSSRQRDVLAHCRRIDLHGFAMSALLPAFPAEVCLSGNAAHALAPLPCIRLRCQRVLQAFRAGHSQITSLAMPLRPILSAICQERLGQHL